MEIENEDSDDGRRSKGESGWNDFGDGRSLRKRIEGWEDEIEGWWGWGK